MNMIILLGVAAVSEWRSVEINYFTPKFFEKKKINYTISKQRKGERNKIYMYTTCRRGTQDI